MSVSTSPLALGLAIILLSSTAVAGLGSTTTVSASGCSASVRLTVPTSTTHAYGVHAPNEVVPLECDSSVCTVSVGLHQLPQPLHVYTVHVDGGVALVETLALPPAPHTCGVPSPREGGASPLLVGALYEGWQGPAAYAMSVVAAAGGPQLAVEAIIRAPTEHTMFDVYQRWNAQGDDDGFFWQDEPELGFYCIYRKRANESAGVIPDCPNITATLRRQLGWLTTAGVDFVTADGTNLCTPSPEADVLQTRPMQVLFEEWAAFRAAGVSTPRIAAWQRSVTGCTLWADVLDLYNNASYVDLVLTDPVTGKKVFFVPDSPDAAIVSQIERNGGRDDVLVQEMWALFPTDLYAQGRWAFMSPCTSTGGGGAPVYTTNAVQTGAGITGCNQYVTSNSALGSVAAVSPSFQLSYGSVPFSAAGKFDGLTMKRQFGTLWQAAGRAWADASAALRRGMGGGTADGASAAWVAAARSVLASHSVGNSTARSSSALPNNLYFSSWNEFISQPQPNPFGGPFSFSMGLSEAGGTAPNATSPYTSLFVDTFGTAIGRDIEPTVYGGNVSFLTMASCVRVARLALRMETDAVDALRHARTHADRARATALWASLETSFVAPPGSTAACSVTGEACCTFNETTDGYVSVWSVARDDKGDSLVTTDGGELERLTCAGCGWTQVCNAYGGATTFCVDNALAATFDAVRGPFVLHTAGCGTATTGVNGTSPSVLLPGRLPVYRCRDSAPAGGHFLSPTPDCAASAGAVLEATIGCADASPSSNMPRALRQCRAAAAGSRPAPGPGQSGAGGVPSGYYATLDYACVSGDDELASLGYVH